MSTAQEIFNMLHAAGLSVAGALGVLGNWDCESNLEPCRLQGDFSQYRTASKSYVSQITSGAISREKFMRDGKGFGLAQWTYNVRKGQLYDFWRQSGDDLDSLSMQTRFALWELTQPEYSGLFRTLKTSDDIRECVTQVCKLYERPAVNNIEARYSAAQRIAQGLDTSGSSVNTYPQAENPSEGPQTGSGEKSDETYWPPRGYLGGKKDPGLCKGMSGPDVALVCALLRVRGYDLEISEALTEKVEAQLIQYQKDNGLAADGICGKNSWHELLAV